MVSVWQISGPVLRPDQCSPEKLEVLSRSRKPVLFRDFANRPSWQNAKVIMVPGQNGHKDMTRLIRADPLISPYFTMASVPYSAQNPATYTPDITHQPKATLVRPRAHFPWRAVAIFSRRSISVRTSSSVDNNTASSGPTGLLRRERLWGCPRKSGLPVWPLALWTSGPVPIPRYARPPLALYARRSSNGKTSMRVSLGRSEQRYEATQNISSIFLFLSEISRLTAFVVIAVLSDRF